MQTQTNSGGLGLGTILFVVFLILKLTGHIDWSWWWVTCPIWIPLAFVLALFLGAAVFTLKKRISKKVARKK